MIFKRVVPAILFTVVIAGFFNIPVIAQEMSDVIQETQQEATISASESAKIASQAAILQKKEEEAKKDNVTQPEQPEQKDEILQLFEQRPIDGVNPFNFFGAAVRYAVSVGVPANTIFLILILPLLATLVAFVRHVIGLPTLGLYVPIALSITLVGTGITAGLLLLIAILLGAIIAKHLLKKIKIMQLPKVALSMFVVSLCIFITITVAAVTGWIAVRTLSIFPVLLLILLSERIVELQLERSLSETISITLVTIVLAVLGYVLLNSLIMRNIVLLYPELVLLLVPANILIGRYFGLRLTEYYRFSPLRNASK